MRQQTQSAGKRCLQHQQCGIHQPWPTRHTRAVVQQAHALRQPKDPKAFKDMDELRAHLEADRPGFISGVLNLLSNASFGQAGLQQPWWSPFRLYRRFTEGLMYPGSVMGSDDDDPWEADLPDDPINKAVKETHKHLGPLLMLSRSDVKRMAKRYPQVLSMSPAEVASRLLDMREVLPGCDVCLLVYMRPDLFLSGDARLRRQQLQAAAVQLNTRLKGARIAEVIMFDPEVLFLDLNYGLSEMCDLWDVDEQCLAASEPRHIATAIRALSLKRGERVQGV